MNITKQDTGQIKGLSILAMVCVHLFCTLNGPFTSWLFVFGKPFSYYLGQVSDFCIMAYCFCSGYALMVCYHREGKLYFRKRLTSLLRFILNYWIILILFTLVSLLIGQGDSMPGSIGQFMGNMFLYRINYNGAWWFVLTYTFMVLLSPLTLKAMNRFPWITMLLSGVLYCAAYYIRFKLADKSWFLEQFGFFGISQFELLTGAFFCKKEFYAKLKGWWNSHFSGVVGNSLLLLLFLGITLCRTLVLPTAFVSPASGILIVFGYLLLRKPKKVCGFFNFMGKHSTNIWLIHMFFYLVMFKNLVFVAKYPFFIFILMFIITIPISWLIQKIHKLLCRVMPFKKLDEKLSNS